jgi:hypothetical protein
MKIECLGEDCWRITLSREELSRLYSCARTLSEYNVGNPDNENLYIAINEAVNHATPPTPN